MVRGRTPGTAGKSIRPMPCAPAIVSSDTIRSTIGMVTPLSAVGRPSLKVISTMEGSLAQPSTPRVTVYRSDGGSMSGLLSTSAVTARPHRLRTSMTGRVLADGTGIPRARPNSISAGTSMPQSRAGASTVNSAPAACNAASRPAGSADGNALPCAMAVAPSMAATSRRYRAIKGRASAAARGSVGGKAHAGATASRAKASRTSSTCARDAPMPSARSRTSFRSRPWPRSSVTVATSSAPCSRSQARAADVTRSPEYANTTRCPVINF